MTRDQTRARILKGLIYTVKMFLEEAGEDEELKQVLMKLYLDLNKKKRSLVQVAEGEE